MIRPLSRGLMFLLAACLIPSAARAQGTATETIGLEINIEPVFFVESSSEAGGNLELEPAQFGESSASQTATVVIHTNQGRPYRILQRLEQDLLSERGFELSKEQVLFLVSDGIHGGRSEVKSPQPLTTDSVVVFTSSAKGDADQFTILYSSTPSREVVPSGTYRARLFIEEESR